jgi:2,3-bisphosphoglycerate-independent phosphoglycerate mutase
MKTHAKYAIVLPDGAADEPLIELDGRTPLEAAKTPNMDWVASQGRLGRVVTVPKGFSPGSDVATLSLFGYDVHVDFRAGAVGSGGEGNRRGTGSDDFPL